MQDLNLKQSRFHFPNTLCAEKQVLTLVIYDRGMFTWTKVKFNLEFKKKKKIVLEVFQV